MILFHLGSGLDVPLVKGCYDSTSLGWKEQGEHTLAHVIGRESEYLQVVPTEDGRVSRGAFGPVQHIRGRPTDIIPGGEPVEILPLAANVVANRQGRCYPIGPRCISRRIRSRRSDRH